MTYLDIRNAHISIHWVGFCLPCQADLSDNVVDFFSHFVLVY